MADTASHRSRPVAPGQTWTRVFPAHADQIRHARKVVALALEGFPAGAALLQGLAELGGCGLTGHDSGHLLLFGGSEEMPYEFADRGTAAA